MTRRSLDITGPVSPFCLLTVQKKAKALLPSDELIITCDSIPTATTLIPRIARDEGLDLDSLHLPSGHWEITLKKQHSRNPAGPDP